MLHTYKKIILKLNHLHSILSFADLEKKNFHFNILFQPLIEDGNH